MLRKLAVAVVAALAIIGTIAGAWVAVFYGSLNKDRFDPVPVVRKRLATTTAPSSTSTTASAAAVTTTPVSTATDALATTQPPQTEPPPTATPSTTTVTTTTATPYVATSETSPALPDTMFDSFLLVGQDGPRADTMILLLLPADGSVPIVASLPRDLYVPNPCTGHRTRLNAGLRGCGSSATGTELLAVMVADYTGVNVDHVVRVDFAGFVATVDLLGGTDVCVRAPTRDSGSGLNLPSGCTHVDGAGTLAWVRARHLEELVDGAWVRSGSSDLTRQTHQQEILFQVAAQVTSFDALPRFAAIAKQAAPYLHLGNLSLADATATAWRLRTATPDTVTRVAVRWDSYTNYVTSQGAMVLRPAVRFNDLLAAAYPPAARP